MDFKKIDSEPNMLFSEAEIKALCMIATARTAMFLTFEATSFQDERASTKALEGEIMTVIDGYLEKKRSKNK